MVDAAAPAQLFSLADKVVVISGASSGLGARWASVLAAAGAHVVLFARRETELNQVAATLPGSFVVVGDVTSEDDRQRLVETALERFGSMDVLVNSAGPATSRPARDMPLGDFHEMINTDLSSLFALTQLVGAVMIDGSGGSIIKVASLAADRSLDRYPLAAYSDAKAGVVALTRNLAAEWGPHGVRVNAISPAFFPTRLSGFLEDPSQVEWIRGHKALRRTARLEELDGTVLFLASDASSFTTGQNLIVDGGWSVY